MKSDGTVCGSRHRTDLARADRYGKPTAKEIREKLSEYEITFSFGFRSHNFEPLS